MCPSLFAGIICAVISSLLESGVSFPKLMPWLIHKHYFQSSRDDLDFEPRKITVSLINGLPPWHDKAVCNLQNVWKFRLSFLKSVCLSWLCICLALLTADFVLGDSSSVLVFSFRGIFPVKYFPFLIQQHMLQPPKPLLSLGMEKMDFTG